LSDRGHLNHLGRIPPTLSDLPWELPHNFLGLDEDTSDFGKCKVVIMPVPYESTISYGGGTRKGPSAIIEASRHIELYDQELDICPSNMGIHTFPALELMRDSVPGAMAELEAAYARVVEVIDDRFLIMLGGEHTVSVPAIRTQAAKIGGDMSVLQLDAHIDLRTEFEGSAYSHACAMNRIVEVANLVSVGVRGASEEEVKMANTNDDITLIWSDEMRSNDTWMDRAVEALRGNVYLTVDVDYFDPSLVPSTGTPEPGGGDWYRTLEFLRRVFQERTVVACDVVELAPHPGVHAPDFLVAKLIYKIIGYRFKNK
jgi:agmatinase